MLRPFPNFLISKFPRAVCLLRLLTKRFTVACGVFGLSQGIGRVVARRCPPTRALEIERAQLHAMKHRPER